ncbi:hypothetical protein NL676_013386 [Syzygium grande]|nr:hypothetical protein NL676_013386 [Syzygium grande]
METVSACARRFTITEQHCAASRRILTRGEPPYYSAEIDAMKASESSTIFIDFAHVMLFSDLLQSAISDEFLRFEPYLKNACKRFVMEQKPTFTADDNPHHKRPHKDSKFMCPFCCLCQGNWPVATAEIGKLVSVTGEATRT